MGIFFSVHHKRAIVDDGQIKVDIRRFGGFFDGRRLFPAEENDANKPHHFEILLSPTASLVLRKFILLLSGFAAFAKEVDELLEKV